MKHRRINSLMVSAAMAFNVIGASARTLMADTDGFEEETRTEESEQIADETNTDISEDTIQTDEE